MALYLQVSKWAVSPDLRLLNGSYRAPRRATNMPMYFTGNFRRMKACPIGIAKSYSPHCEKAPLSITFRAVRQGRPASLTVYRWGLAGMRVADIRSGFLWSDEKDILNETGEEDAQREKRA